MRDKAGSSESFLDIARRYGDLERDQKRKEVFLTNMGSTSPKFLLDLITIRSFQQGTQPTSRG
jgi:hypothetical protein